MRGTRSSNGLSTDHCLRAFLNKSVLRGFVSAFPTLSESPTGCSTKSSTSWKMPKHPFVASPQLAMKTISGTRWLRISTKYANWVDLALHRFDGERSPSQFTPSSQVRKRPSHPRLHRNRQPRQRPPQRLRRLIAISVGAAPRGRPIRAGTGTRPYKRYPKQHRPGIRSASVRDEHGQNTRISPIFGPDPLFPQPISSRTIAGMECNKPRISIRGIIGEIPGVVVGARRGTIRRNLPARDV